MVAAHGISVALLRPLAELLGRLDVDPVAFLDGLGIDADTTPNTYIAGTEVDQRLDDIAARNRDQTFALTLARIAVNQPLGLFSHMVWLSGTVRDALRRAVRFYAMVTRRTTLTLCETGPRAALRQHGVPGVTRGNVLTEFAFASLALRAGAATAGRFRVHAVQFSHTRDASTHAAYRTVFGAPVRFGAASDELEFDAGQLDLRLHTADPITSAALEMTIAQLTSTTPRTLFADRVRRAASMSVGERVSFATVAKRLCTSERTLRRHLERQGLSLRAIVDELRRERADKLLATGMPIKEVAFGLGFSEPSAFSRAYKRWTGKPPRLGASNEGIWVK